MEKNFDLDFVFSELTACYEKTKSLDMDSYIKFYSEFNKFFTLMGTVFGFVASDVTSKLDILQNFRDGTNGDKFTSVEEMIKFEKRENLLVDSKYVSGCRTLLRLHRALQFLALFLEEVGQYKMEDNLAAGCQKAYNMTLSQYHPWIVQKTALVAMYALPNKRGLLDRIKHPDETEQYYTELLPKTVSAMKEIFYRTQKFYEDHDLLALP